METLRESISPPPPPAHEASDNALKAQDVPGNKRSWELLHEYCWREIGKYLSAREVVKLSHVDKYLQNAFTRNKSLINVLIERYYGQDKKNQLCWRRPLGHLPAPRNNFLQWQQIHLTDDDRNWLNGGFLRLADHI